MPEETDQIQTPKPVKKPRDRKAKPAKKRKYTRRAKRSQGGSISGVITKHVTKALKAERKALKAEVRKLVAKQVDKALKAAFR